MPKNPHQRPQPIQRNHSVPRHGTQQPPSGKQAVIKKVPPPASIPTLESLLAQNRSKS